MVIKHANGSEMSIHDVALVKLAVHYFIREKQKVKIDPEKPNEKPAKQKDELEKQNGEPERKKDKHEKQDGEPAKQNQQTPARKAQ